MVPSDPDFFLQGVLKQDRRIIAKTMTLVESRLSGHQELAAAVIRKILPYSGKSIRLGITGIPGVGKSTFIENLGLTLVDQGFRVAVLAVDPSSKRSGGSILGDKTRMEKLSSHPDAFIRPSPAGDTLGGVAARTREIMLICEAAGYDVVLVETVGVGQSEVRVASMVDFFLVLMIAGAGDELQGIKKGVLEMADAVAINKADGDNLERVKTARRELEMAMHMVRGRDPDWYPRVLTCSSVTKGGTDDVWQTVVDHHEKLKASGGFELKRKKQALDWMWTLVEDGLWRRFKDSKAVADQIPAVSKQVEEQVMSPSAAAEKLLSFF